MNSLAFTKMQAQGNDFVVLDGRRSPLPALDTETIRALADRRLGIGCDQVLVLLPDEQTDARLRIYNSDGSEAEHCGNGLRCVGWLLMAEQRVEQVHIRLADRVATARKGHSGIRVRMGAGRVTARTDAHVDVDLGNPHSVFFEAVESFPQDRNIEIVSGQIGDDVYADIIERGAGHTPACGTGACAIAVAVWEMAGHTRPQHIHMPGGQVTVSGNRDDLVLEGPVAMVFSGRYRMDAQNGVVRD